MPRLLGLQQTKPQRWQEHFPRFPLKGYHWRWVQSTLGNNSGVVPGPALLHTMKGSPATPVLHGVRACGMWMHMVQTQGVGTSLGAAFKRRNSWPRFIFSPPTPTPYTHTTGRSKELVIFWVIIWCLLTVNFKKLTFPAGKQSSQKWSASVQVALFHPFTTAYLRPSSPSLFLTGSLGPGGMDSTLAHFPKVLTCPLF